MTELKPEFSEARAAIGRQQITTPAGYNSPVKITNDPLSARQAAQVNQLNDLISLLKRMQSLPARVVSDARGQLLLATQLGNIQPQNQLPLQPGQQVQLLLDATTGKPKVVPVRPDNAAVRLPVDGNRELAQLLSPQKPMLAKVFKQSTGSTQIRLAGVQMAVPQLQGVAPDQLFSARITANGEQIELQPLERKPLLKALLTQLVARSQVAPTNNVAAPLVELFRQLAQPTSTANQPREPAVQTATATQPGQRGIELAAPERNAAPQPISLLQLLPSPSVAQPNIISQWVSPFIGRNPVTADLTGGPALANPVRLIQQVSNGSLLPANLERLLSSLLPDTPKNSPPPAQAQSSPQESRLAQEIQQLQLREAARLVEQVGNQVQTQRTSVSLQQEIQQPLAFAVSIPVIEGKQVRQLDIKVEQRNQSQAEDKQGWDVRLSFEFGAMGMVSCYIFLLGSEVSSSFYCEQDKTRRQIEAALPTFRQQLLRAGFQPRELNSYQAPAEASAPTDHLKISESILDIEV